MAKVIHHYHKDSASSGFGTGFGGCLGVMAALFLVFCLITGGCIGCTILGGAAVKDSVEDLERADRKRQAEIERQRQEFDRLLEQGQDQEPQFELKPRVEPKTEPKPTKSFTMARYAQLATGMPYDDVKRLFEHPGELVNSSDLFATYKWANEDGSYVMATFSADWKLTSFSQFGLN